jgi:hypothetical protein
MPTKLANVHRNSEQAVGGAPPAVEFETGANAAVKLAGHETRAGEACWLPRVHAKARLPVMSNEKKARFPWTCIHEKARGIVDGFIEEHSVKMLVLVDRGRTPRLPQFGAKNITSWPRKRGSILLDDSRPARREPCVDVEDGVESGR